MGEGGPLIKVCSLIRSVTLYETTDTSCFEQRCRRSALRGYAYARFANCGRSQGRHTVCCPLLPIITKGSVFHRKYEIKKDNNKIIINKSE